MISSIVKSDRSSQINKVLQRLDEYDVKFAKQERVNEELQRTNEGLQRTNEGLQRTNKDLQKTIAGLSANVARVSYTSPFITPA
jgi:predicted RNase H-like nuclease (RuvC/YqgF family)